MDTEVRSQTSKNYRIYSTILEVLQARGYVIPPDNKSITIKQFQARQRELEKPVFFMDNEDEGDEEKKPVGLAVYCNFTKQKITGDLIQRFIRSFVSDDKRQNRGIYENIKNFFIVAPTVAKTGTIDVDKSAQSMANMHDQLKIQFFKDEDLMFNVLKHDLVPQHILLNQKEKNELLKYYNVKQSQLPKLLLHDPVARFLGLKRGQVVKIIRKSQTAGLYTTYRVVV